MPSPKQARPRARAGPTESPSPAALPGESGREPDQAPQNCRSLSMPKSDFITSPRGCPPIAGGPGHGRNDASTNVAGDTEAARIAIPSFRPGRRGDWWPCQCSPVPCRPAFRRKLDGRDSGCEVELFLVSGWFLCNHSGSLASLFSSRKAAQPKGGLARTEEMG